MSYHKCKIGILCLKYGNSKKTHKVVKYTFNSRKQCMKNHRKTDGDYLYESMSEVSLNFYLSFIYLFFYLRHWKLCHSAW